jgi:hypothetical protein
MKRLLSGGTLLCTTLIGASFNTGVSEVGAGSPPVSFDVSGQTLEFEHPSNVEVGDLPFTYGDILPSLVNGCLQGRISRLVRENVDVNDVDETGSDEIEFDMEAVPNNVEPVQLQALTEWQLDFLFDPDCDPLTNDSVEAEVRNMCLHMEDIDLYQFFGVAGADSYVRTSDSVLTFVNRSGYLTAVDTTNAGSNTTDEKHWAQFGFESVTSFRFRLGIDVGSTDDDAVFHLAFSCPQWTTETVEQSTAVEFELDIDVDHYLRRAQESQEAQESLPNTR